MKMVSKFKFISTLGALGFALVLTNCGPVSFSAKTQATNEKIPGGVTPGEVCPGEVPDPQGCMTAKCHWNNGQPYIELDWCTYSNANSNSVQKGDSYPSNPSQFWGWVQPNSAGTGSNFPMNQHAYDDHDVALGNTYSYRAKFRPETPSNVSLVQIPLDNCTCK